MQLLLLSWICLGRLASAAFCNAFSSGPVANNTFIQAANATLIVPGHSPKRGLLSLWTGMGTSNGDLIQALVESYNGSVDGQCGVLKGREWCAWASTLVERGQIGGHQVIVRPNDHVQQSYIYNEMTQLYDQYTLVNGKVKSKLRTKSGKALGWGTAEECQPEEPCGQVSSHTWIDVVLVLNTPDPTYNSTFRYLGASGDMATNDGGKTWQASAINIDACDFNFTPSGS